MKLYRLLTGKDDSSFCARVEQALNEGWTLHGSPALTYDEKSKHVVCAQAIIKDEDGDYAGFKSLKEMKNS